MKKLIVILSCLVFIAHCTKIDQNMLSDNKNYIESMESVASSLKELTGVVDKKAFNAEFLVDMAGKIGPIFGIIGAAFSIFAALIPKGPTPELLALQEGFKSMHVLFDGLERKLENMVVVIEREAVYNRYTKLQERLWRLLVKHQQYVRCPNALTLAEMRKVCTFAQTDPAAILDLIHKEVTLKGGSIGLSLLPTILEGSEYDITKVIAMSRMITADATQAALMRHLCLGLRSKNVTDIETNSVDNTNTKLNEITRALSDLVEQLKRDFRKTMEKEVLEMIGQPREGRPDIEKLKNHLLAKYTWLDFGVLAWWATHKTVGDTPPDQEYLNVTGTDVYHFTVPGYHSGTVNWINREGGDLWRKLSNFTEPAVCKIAAKYNKTQLGDVGNELRQKYLVSPTSMCIVRYTVDTEVGVIPYSQNTAYLVACMNHDIWLGY